MRAVCFFLMVALASITPAVGQANNDVEVLNVKPYYVQVLNDGDAFYKIKNPKLNIEIAARGACPNGKVIKGPQLVVANNLNNKRVTRSLGNSRNGKRVFAKNYETFTFKPEVRDLFSQQDLIKRCNKAASDAAREANTPRSELIANGWSKALKTNALQASLNLRCGNKVQTGFEEYKNQASDNAPMYILCASFTGASGLPKSPYANAGRPNKADKTPKRPKKTPKKKTSAKGLDGSERGPNKRPERDTAPPRDTDRKQAKTAEVGINLSALPKPDLHVVSGGIDRADQMSWVLNIANRGDAPSVATKARFDVKLTGQERVTRRFDVPAIPAGRSTQLYVPSMMQVTLIETLRARVDDPSVNDESDERNNTFVFVDQRRDLDATLIPKHPDRQAE